MAEPVQDQAERDDAHLRSLGIKPELRRTLGFLSNFAIAFSFISVSTGTYGNFGVGLSRRPRVLLVVADRHHRPADRRARVRELASHFPVAGSIYQWSKRLSNRTLGWFTGWFYFWAQVVTVTAVAVIVAFVIDGIVQQEGFLDSPDPTGLTSMFTFISLVTRDHDPDQRVWREAAVAAQQHRRRDGDPRDGRLRADPVVLRQQPVAAIVFDTAGTEAATNGNYLAAFALGMFMALFVVYGFDTAGTFGEETLDAAGTLARRHLVGRSRASSARSSCSRSSSRSLTSRRP